MTIRQYGKFLFFQGHKVLFPAWLATVEVMSAFWLGRRRILICMIFKIFLNAAKLFIQYIKTYFFNEKYKFLKCV